MATKLTGKQLTKVSKKDLAEAIDDGNGALYSPDGKRLIKFKNKNLSIYAVKEGTEIIADEAFLCMKNLKEITIPDTVTHIGKSAFVSLRSIKKIVLPATITEIVGITFAICKSLKEVCVPKQCKKAYLKMIHEALSAIPHLNEYNTPESFMSKILPVKYWELLVEI